MVKNKAANPIKDKLPYFFSLCSNEVSEEVITPL